MRLRDDVERTRGVLMLVFVGGRGGVMGGRRRGLGSTERGLLEGSEGGVECTAERLGECANVFGGGESAECGHGWNWIGMTNSTERGGCGPEVYLNVLATIAYLRERLGGENKSRVSDWLPQRLLGLDQCTSFSCHFLIPSLDDTRFLAPRHDKQRHGKSTIVVPTMML